MSFPVEDEGDWGGFGSCAAFASDGGFPSINICVCIYMCMCLCVHGNQNTSLWCRLAGGVAPLGVSPGDARCCRCSVLHLSLPSSTAGCICGPALPAGMQLGWGELFYCCLFQGRARFQVICPGFSVLLDCTRCGAGLASWWWQLCGGPGLGPPRVRC